MLEAVDDDAARQDLIHDGPLLDVRQVTKRYGGFTAVNEVSLSLGAGEVLAVIGPNGAGKSTLLKLVSGAIRPTSGTVRFGGRDVTGRPTHVRSRWGCAMTFQTPLASKVLTVQEQLLAQDRWIAHLHAPRVRPKLESLRHLVDMTGLAPVLHRRPPQLTLGELRRFELARALVGRPRLLLVDEPASGMHADEARELSTTIRAMATSGTGVLLVEHNIPFVRATAGRAMALDAGQVLISGSVDTVLTSPELREAYLGIAPA